MSPLPAADTSSQTAKRPSAPADSPTARTDRPATKPTKTRTRTTATKTATPSAGGSIEEALGAPMRQFTTRAADDVLDLLRERAEAIADVLPAELRGGGPGGAMRLVLTDAILHALELDIEQHAQRVRETRGRELLAQARAKIG